MTSYLPTIGVEVHVELATRTKMFCACPHPSGQPDPNTAVCPVCLGLPGALPTPNARAARLGLRAALAFGGRVNASLRFERKNYAYPDLVKGYQISQYALPVGDGGHIDLPPGDIDPDLDAHDAPGGGLRVRLSRAHLEEDTARLVHQGRDSRVDANRSGAPLLEIVTEPVFHSARAAESYVRRLRTLLVFHGVSRCRPEAGEMRVEANVSVAPMGSKAWGTRTEIKNQAGFQYMRAAIEYEIRRQIAVIEGGGKVVQETRGFDPAKGETFMQRPKEDAHDYRYFPDPDLPAPTLPDAWIAEERERVAASPDDFLAHLAEAGIPPKTVEAVVSQDALGFLREAERAAEAAEAAGAAALGGAAREPLLPLLAKRLVNDVFATMNRSATAILDGALTPAALARAAALEAGGKIDAKGTRRLLEKLFADGGDPDALVAGLGLAAAAGADDGETRAAVAAVLAERPDWVADFRAGKTAVKNAMLGAVMKRLARKGNPRAIGTLLDEALGRS